MDLRIGNPQMDPAQNDFFNTTILNPLFTYSTRLSDISPIPHRAPQNSVATAVVSSIQFSPPLHGRPAVSQPLTHPLPPQLQQQLHLTHQPTFTRLLPLPSSLPVCSLTPPLQVPFSNPQATINLPIL